MDGDIHFDSIVSQYGAATFEETRSLVTDETIYICRSADAVLRSCQETVRVYGRNGSAHIQLGDKIGFFA